MPAHAKKKTVPDDPLPRFGIRWTHLVEEAPLADLTLELAETSIASLQSQGGSFAGRAYTALPTELHLDAVAYRVHLLRHLRLPLHLDAAACRSS